MSAAYREKKYSKNDPATITRLAGVALQRVEHIAMDHGIPTEWESVQTTSMKLAPLEGRDLAKEAAERASSKKKLTQTSWTLGRNGSAVDYSSVGGMPEIPPGDHRLPLAVDITKSCAAPFSVTDPSALPAWSTTMRDCMAGGLGDGDGDGNEGSTAVDPRALKVALTASNVEHLTKGDGTWYGYNKRETRSHEGADLAVQYARGPTTTPGNSITDTLFPPLAKPASYETTNLATMPSPDKSRQQRRCGFVPKRSSNDPPLDPLAQRRLDPA